ncbi:pumilio domain-containing protein [Ophiostoma piceae UAMH 11346]|uniref:Pumilio domain-containing protein n=1 Tax=Ophiostoma piceae (strain UAMH 11346) TaxID=1262450 RepID=S3D225_OPHP1|nr:pumilio domain-containing protein [Ophiostoma piceae UAMH 11346]
MANPSRSDLTLNSFPILGGQQARSTSPATSNPSPIDPTAASAASRTAFGLPPPGLGVGSKIGASRSSAGSPSHEMGGSSRLYKRAREIQAQEGIPSNSVNLWPGPPTSGNSTPLRETIPESPTDGFPEFPQLPSTSDFFPAGRRARAGTVPSRFSPGGAGIPPLAAQAVPGALPKSSRPTPSQTPYQSASPGLDSMDGGVSSAASSSSALLSRLRAGSMPQRSPFVQTPSSMSPFGPSIFSSWNPTTRERGSTLASIASLGSNGPSSPAQSAFSREGTGEDGAHMRTLDYLGLAETPQPVRATLATPYIPNYQEFPGLASRFRSYSVNNKDKYQDDEDDYEDDAYASYPADYAAVQGHLQEQFNATQAAIHHHNLAVQAFATQAISRPRARTAGVLDAPGSRLRGGYIPTPSRLDSTMTAADIQLPEEKDFDEQLSMAVAGMSLGRSNSRNNNTAAGGAAAGLLSADEPGLEGPTSALWLGSIPTSTTTSTLTEIFKSHGPILSARVLTLKNCGFVNFERVESAISAKNSLNGKEIFPGAGPVRINFAKPPSSSNTPGHDGAFPSPSPDPFAASEGRVPGIGAVPGAPSSAGPTTPGVEAASAGAPAGADAATSVGAAGLNVIPPAVSSPASLNEISNDIMKIVVQFGASDEDAYRISSSLNRAIQFTNFVDEIPTVPEPSSSRVYDAPKLRDIRKRIDNQSLSQADIERIAIEMLPEIAELASDYLGNTVVQKLFEHCSDDLRDAMLAEIAPHIAEIGVHKNGTWAAQKIIDVCKTPQQMTLIAESVRPYTLPLFLDQYGNYVLQGCLKFGAPYTDYIFETMMSRLWEVAQGRFGARAMRACLESHHATKDQQRMLAAVIALNSVQLATNANGALLLTWFLDTCTFPQRRTVLAPQLVPYLVHLCTHKVAYLTVLKVVNQKAEPEARDTILQALFSPQNDSVLEAILNDSASGSTLIYKVITTPFFEESFRGEIVDSVKNVLVRIKAQPSQGYKRLMDEVGLSTRGSGGNSGDRNGGGGGSSVRDHSTSNEKQRPSSRQANGHHHQNQGQQPGQSQQSLQHQQQAAQQPQQRTPPHSNQAPFNNGGPGPYFNASPNAPGYDAGYAMPRGDGGVDTSLPPPHFPPYNGQGQMYGAPPMQMPPYQQMGRGYYPPAMQASGFNYNGSGASVPPADAYRNGTGGALPPVGGLAGQASYGYNNMGGAPYGYGGPGGPPPYMGGDGSGAGGNGGRRGRQGRNRDISPRQFH